MIFLCRWHKWGGWVGQKWVTFSGQATSKWQTMLVCLGCHNIRFPLVVMLTDCDLPVQLFYPIMNSCMVACESLPQEACLCLHFLNHSMRYIWYTKEMDIFNMHKLRNLEISLYPVKLSTTLNMKNISTVSKSFLLPLFVFVVRTLNTFY